MMAKDPHDRNEKKRRRGRKSSEKNPTGNRESVTEYHAHKTPLIQLDDDAPTWFDYGKDLPGRNNTISSDPPKSSDRANNTLVSKYRDMGSLIFKQEMQLSKHGQGNSSDERWVENTMRKGTLKDRIAAMSVTVSSDPIHKFYALDGLLALVGCTEQGGKTNSRAAQLTAEALDDLFMNTFLPQDRKLVTLEQRPLYRYEPTKNGTSTKKTLSPRILLLWRFEEIVKEKYDLYIRKYLASTLHDGAETHKIATLQSVATLLSSVPQGEAQLLSVMVNKLGDPAKKVASAAGHQLRVVLQKHPNMQLVIAREVQQLAHRPHLSPRALYNCIVFLNQLKLKKEMKDPNNPMQQETTPSSLIKTYFRLFQVAIKKSKDQDPDSEESGMKSRLLSALLTGVNRAHPYLPEEDKDMDEYVDELYRVVHSAAPSACTQALMLLFHLAVGSQLENEERNDAPKTETQIGRVDRFYRALYATLSKPTMIGLGKHLTMYFNLLYKAMKNDSDVNRVNAFAKRLMCTVLHSNAAPIAGSVFLLNEIAKTHEGLRLCMEQPPDESDEFVILDETKREPRAALKSSKDSDDKRDKERHPPSWELSLVAHHYHPSVAKFGETIGHIEYAGDPLKDFGLAPFLDKFAYRNPKSKEKLQGHYKRGESIAERRSGTQSAIEARLELPVNDPAFLERDDVNEQDVFFRNFFVERARRDEIKGITRSSKQELDDEELEQAEDGALDAAEDAEGLDTGKNFEEYERAWDSDPEEEAFVDALAQKLIDDAADGAVDFDDEDPDMDDWGDMYGDKEEGTKDSLEDQGSDIEDEEDDDEDSDDEEVPDDEDSNEEENASLEDGDEFMDASDSNSSDGEEFDKAEFGEQEMGEDEEDSDDDHENDLAFADSEDEDEDDNEESAPSRKKAKTTPTFASAEEYEERVNKSFLDLTRSGKAGKAAEDSHSTPKNSKGKRRSKNRR